MFARNNSASFRASIRSLLAGGSAFASKFSSVRSFWKRVRPQLFPCDIFKTQIRIVKTVVVELADTFDLLGGQSSVSFGRLFRTHNYVLPLGRLGSLSKDRALDVSVSLEYFTAAGKKRTRVFMPEKQPSCEDYRRMPFDRKVIEHIKSCPDCLALYNELAKGVDRKAYGFRHRN